MSVISWSVNHITGNVTPKIGANRDLKANLSVYNLLLKLKIGNGLIRYKRNKPHTNDTKK